VGNVGRDPFGEPVRAPLSPVELVHLLAEINADDGSTDTFKGVYSAEKAAALKAASFDRAALGARGLAYERLDQLTTEGAAYGAAVLAATGAGAFPDVASACDHPNNRKYHARPGERSLPEDVSAVPRTVPGAASQFQCHCANSAPFPNILNSATNSRACAFWPLERKKGRNDAKNRSEPCFWRLELAVL
jgi:hypothetical protein